MTSFVKRYPLPTYFILAFAAFWAFLPLASVSPALPPALGTFGPALAAIITSGIAEGRNGIKALFQRLREWRVAAPWYVVALGLPVVVGLLAVGIAAVLGSDTASQIGSLSAASLIVFVFAIGEELGWRGFALPRLLVGRSALSASLILGALHAIWHWPLLLLPGQLLSGNPLLAHSSTVLAQSIIFTWIFKHTRGSAFMAVLLHGAINAASILYQGIDPAWTNWLQAAIWVVIAGIIVALTGLDLTRRSTIHTEAAQTG